MSKDTTDTLGTILVESQQRDAIHIAVIPAIAAQTISPGKHVSVENGIAKEIGIGLGLGIVDPFLKNPVLKGQRFWVMLYPKTITSLRHVWTHPAFADEIETKKIYSQEESEKWLREFIQNADCPDYDTVLAIACGEELQLGDEEYYGKSYNDGDYLNFYGRDAHGSIPQEFWIHVQNVTGKEIPWDKQARQFNCSC